MSIPIRTVSTASCSMRCFCFGTGKRTFVILPGLSVQSVMDAADAIAGQYAPLTDAYTIYVFDRRDDLPSSYPIRQAAEDTALVMQSLGLAAVDLFGASQGGMIAMGLAISHPDLVHSLVLGSTAMRMPKERCAVVDRWIRLAAEGSAEALYLDFAEAIYPASVYAEYRDSFRSASAVVTEADLTRFQILASGMHGFDDSDRIGTLRCPVMLFGSQDDAVLGSEAYSEIRERLMGHPGFCSHLYDGYGHASFDTAPDYLERMTRFLKGTDPALS